MRRFRAAVLFPWDPTLMAFYELYRLNTVLLLPRQPGFRRFGRRVPQKQLHVEAVQQIAEHGVSVKLNPPVQHLRGAKWHGHSHGVEQPPPRRMRRDALRSGWIFKVQFFTGWIWSQPLGALEFAHLAAARGR